jgi:hypothetical protein
VLPVSAYSLSVVCTTVAVRTFPTLTLQNFIDPRICDVNQSSNNLASFIFYCRRVASLPNGQYIFFRSSNKTYDNAFCWFIGMCWECRNVTMLLADILQLKKLEVNDQLTTHCLIGSDDPPDTETTPPSNHIQQSSFFYEPMKP